MTYYYPAIIRKREDVYRVDFVDLEQCYGEGKDLDDALEDARYQGVQWILAEMEDTMEFPPQTHLDDIRLREGEEKTMLALLMPREGWDE